MRRSPWAVVAAVFALGAGARGAGAVNLEVFEIAGIGSAIAGPVEVYFNPREYTITKATPWKHHDVQGHDAPTLEFTATEPYRCQFELFFDRYEEGKTVREITDRLEAIAADLRRPPLEVRWGGRDWTNVLLAATTKVTDTASDGTPLAATVTTLWSAFHEISPEPPAPDLLAATITTPKGTASAAIDASTASLLTLKSADVVKAQAVSLQPSGCTSPKVDFHAGDPQRLRATFVFDTSASKSDVRAATAPVEALLPPPQGLSPAATIQWGSSCAHRCILESFSLRFTLFLDDGTPVRAVMNTTWKEFSPAEEQLRGNPRH